MPVHLGAMPLSVRAAIDAFRLEPGDIVMLNDPFHGGTHLPDITLVSPVFLAKDARPSFYVANRAHHSDVGGMSPGSMPVAREIYQEGLILPPIRLARRGEILPDMMALLLANVRTPAEREGDLDRPDRGQSRCRDSAAKDGRAVWARPRVCVRGGAPGLHRARRTRRHPAGAQRAVRVRGRTRRHRLRRHASPRSAPPSRSPATAPRWTSPAPIRRSKAASTPTTL